MKNDRRRGAFTLVELMIGMAISIVVLTSVLVATYSLQRSFEAANYRMSAQDDQLRMLDYLTRDLHAASGVAILNSGTQLNVTLPVAADSSLDLNLGSLLNPLLSASSPATPTTPQAVSYFVEGGSLIRSVNGTQTDIADTIADLTFTRNGSFMQIDITFTPQYSNSPTTATQPMTRASSSVLLFNIASN